jgi:tetratricopeptide (TPR) repeat protein
MSGRGWRSVLASAVFAALTSCSPATTGDRAAAYARAVSAARASADEQLAEGRVDEAIADLERALAIPRPDTDAAKQLVQDVAFALGSARLASRDPLGALRIADEALVLSSTPSVFLANLHALRGMALELSGQALPAAEAYHQALVIHQSLYDALLASYSRSTP